MITLVHKYIEGRQRRGFESNAELQKTDFRGRFDSPLKHMKSGKTSTMLHFAKKGVCVFSWIYSGKNAYALFGQPSNPEMQISITKMSHLPRVKRAILKSVETRNAGQAREKREPCYADGRDVNCQRPLWRTVWCFLNHLKNTAREHRALPLVGV